jgi:hypothetical protein
LQRDSNLASKVNVLVWRSGLAAALLLAGWPLLAQDNAASTTPPPASASNIGPNELSNFSLNGTVTRRAEEQPADQSPATTVRETAPPATSVANRPASTRQVAAERPAQPSQQAAIDPIASRPTLRSPAARTAPATTAPPPASAVPLPAAAPSGFSPLPWIAALLMLVAGAVLYFGLQRRGQRYSATGVSEFVAPSPQALAAPSPPVAKPAPAPRPDPIPEGRGAVTSKLREPSLPPGLVSTSLRPWIELELEPSQALVNDEHAAIAFDVTLFNSGSAPARDVAVEACLINAGQQQDVQLTEFYTTPGEVRDKIPAVAPLARVTLKSAVRLPRSAVQEYEVEGRKLFMPMVAVNSHYRWSSGEGQSAASFMVGRSANDREKLGPLRLDQGARGWKGLAARRYEKGIRR